MPELIHVAVGVIIGSDGRVLIAKRPHDAHQGGLWEFPGGKLESGESVLAALERELQEELGIHIDPRRCFPLKKIRHRYGDREVLLDTWRVDSYRGEARGLQNQPLAWSLPEALDSREFPEANREIIRLLQLPSLLAITGESATRAEFSTRLEAALQRGIRLVQFRQPGLGREPARRRLEDAMALCRQYDARLLVNSSTGIAERLPGQGLHANAATLMSLRERPVGPDDLFSASCHNADELAHAERLGADLVLLSPVNRTASHPHDQPLGWNRFQSLAANCSLPVFALGGLTVGDLSRAYAAGAHGVAGISDFWR